MPNPQRWHIAYDISDPKHLRRVERTLAAAGARVHESLFICELDAGELLALQRRLSRIISLASDVVRYAPVCGQCAGGTQEFGAPAQQSNPLDLVAWIV